MKKSIPLLTLFLTFISFAQVPLHRFNFDNNLNSNLSHSVAASLSSTNTTYVAGRNAASTAAIRINNTTSSSFLSGAISDMPVGTKSRSFACWIKLNSNINQGFWQIGTPGGVANFGFTRTVSGNTNNITRNGSAIATHGIAYDTAWHLYVVTFNGSGAPNSVFKIYRDDIEVASITEQSPNGTFITTNTVGNLLRIGLQYGSETAGIGNFDIDEFQIFDYALTAAQVENIYYNTPSPATAASVVNLAPTNIGLNSATINFMLGQSNAYTTTTINYGIGNMATSIAGPSSTGNGETLSANLTNLLPGTTYTVRVTTNSPGGVPGAVYTFTTLPTASLLYHFEFNNSYDASVGSGTFSCQTLPGFTGNGTSPNAAVNINVPNSTGRDAVTLSANLPNLPVGAAPRSIAFRVLFNQPTVSATENYVFSYGTGANTQNYSFYRLNNQAFSVVNSWGIGNDKGFSLATNDGTWYSYVVMFDGTNTTLYRDGVQVTPTGTNSVNSHNVNTVGTTMFLGRSQASNFGQGTHRLDDLKIYSGILTQAEITALSQSTLTNTNFTTTDFNVKIYPNPASDIVNIETENELQSVEIYSLQGQKVLSSTLNAINISNLASGVYMVRMQDVEGNAVMQKFVKK